ncbi:hypothetical protein HDK77DRAFT_453361 [Phyllosticta capitalensis]
MEILGFVIFFFSSPTVLRSRDWLAVDGWLPVYRLLCRQRWRATCAPTTPCSVHLTIRCLSHLLRPSVYRNGSSAVGTYGTALVRLSHNRRTCHGIHPSTTHRIIKDIKRHKRNRSFGAGVLVCSF